VSEFCDDGECVNRAERFFSDNGIVFAKYCERHAQLVLRILSMVSRMRKTGVPDDVALCWAHDATRSRPPNA
jgi:hypothetical protein